MRCGCLLALCGLAAAQSTDPYESLRAKNYEQAIVLFRRAITTAPKNAGLRKDLAYTYLKIGENVLARDEFFQAVEIDASDTQAALEYAFLSNDTGRQQQARRVFDRLRKTGNTIAEQAFQNIDRPLAEGIRRWREAIRLSGGDFGSHYELAQLAERRDELELAAEHYERAWRLKPERRSLLVDMGRTWMAMGRSEQGHAALLAASRGGEPRTGEAARQLLPARYPYVPEFRRALDLDPSNVELRRELAYLLLKMGRQGEAEAEFRIITSAAPGDLLSAAQLGFLLLAHGEQAAAIPLLERVLGGDDDELANRVRAVLRMPQKLHSRPPAGVAGGGARRQTDGRAQPAGGLSQGRAQIPATRARKRSCRFPRHAHARPHLQQLA